MPKPFGSGLLRQIETKQAQSGGPHECISFLRPDIRLLVSSYLGFLVC
jgi:hypothetical protein